MRRSVLFLASLLASCADAQQKPAPPSVETTVIVLGSPIPVSEQESARSVVSLDTQRAPLAFHEVEDYLRTDSSVDIQQRGGGGIMADISVRGASFEQTLVLVNGLRMDDAETAHFTFCTATVRRCTAPMRLAVWSTFARCGLRIHLFA
jgi:vitamin B12 transporter